LFVIYLVQSFPSSCRASAIFCASRWREWSTIVKI